MFDFLISLPRLEFKGNYDLKAVIGALPVDYRGDLIGIAGKSIEYCNLSPNLNSFKKIEFIYRIFCPLHFFNRKL